jgi:hypothetical protein
LNEEIVLEGRSPDRNTQVDLALRILSLGSVEVDLYELLKWGSEFSLHEFPVGEGLANSLQVDIGHIFQLA